MPETNVLFLGVGAPVPTFIRNRILQLDKTGNLNLVVLVPIESLKEFPLENGLVMPQLPLSFKMKRTIIPLIWFSLKYPLFTLRLWKSLGLYSIRTRLRSFIKYHSLVRVKKINVVHFQWIASSDEIKWVRTYFKAPVIINARGSQLTVYPTTGSGYREKIHESLLESDYIHAVSQSMAEACIEYGAGPGKIFINYNGIDTDKFRSLKNNTGRQEIMKLISTGSLIWRKGYLWQFIIIKLLKEKGINAELIIIGDGPDRRGLEYTSKRMGLEECIRLIGKVPHEQVPQYLNEADIYISTSAAEGLSNSVLEAVACGLPVVAFDCEGMNEVINNGHNGFIVPFGDIESMAEKIRLLYNDRQLIETMGCNCALIAKEKFDYKIHLQKMIEFYKTICKLDE